LQSATAPAQWPSPTIIIVNPSLAFGNYGGRARARPLRLGVGVVVSVRFLALSAAG
jgi:hypothetical protein